MAARYWVGGTASWDATAGTKWALTSGGAGGQTVPGTADTVFFDANSGANTVTLGSGYNPTISTLTLTGFTGTLAFDSQNISLGGNNTTIFTQPTTCTITGTPIINCTYSGATGTRIISTASVTEVNAVSINVTAGTDNFSNTSGSVFKNLNFTGFGAGTFANFPRTIYGNLTASSSMTFTAGATATTFSATSGIQRITTASKTLDFPLTQNNLGATLQLEDNLTMGSTRTFTLTAGDLHINNLTLSTGLFASSNSNTRNIDFKSGNITLTQNGATIWTTATTTGLTILGTPVVNCTYAGSTGTRTITTGVLTEANTISFNVTAGTDIFAITTTAYIKNLSFTGFSGTLSNGGRNIYGNLTISSGMTLTAGTLGTTFAGTSGTQQITTANKTLDFPFIFNGVGGTFAFQDALTQGSTRAFTVTNGTVQLKNGVTSTVGAFATSGTNQKFLQSTTLGSTATLSQASGTVDVSYLTIRDITATGGATFNAFVDQNNVDAGNVNGWDFGISPIVGGAEYTYALRSLTEQRRF
jgi:hypothetical protein